MNSRVLGAFRADMTAKLFHFDPTSEEHRQAYLKLETGVQCEAHRFLLVPYTGEPLFEDVLNLMRYRLAQHCCTCIIQTEGEICHS
jgi:hypothetical protein